MKHLSDYIVSKTFSPQELDELDIIWNESKMKYLREINDDPYLELYSSKDDLLPPVTQMLNKKGLLATDSETEVLIDWIEYYLI